MIYLFYSKGVQQQLSPGFSWMNGIFYSCLISHWGFYDIFILWQGVWCSNWAQEPAEWMESQRILLMFGQLLIYLWYIYSIARGMQQQLSTGISWMKRPAHLLLTFDQLLWFLWYIYSLARGMGQQLSPGISWMNGRPTHLFLSLISHCIVSITYLLYSKGYAAVTGPMNQLNEWKAHASFTHIWSATVVSMIHW